ncbi:hypothetical protein A0257_23160 (plasmid) [Hymenobacter psoromatis]|nr:hypothetical protein A0257_23160 [Hymenobacter psoromatis]
MNALLLRNGHLQFTAELVQRAFAGEQQLRRVYYPERRALLLAPKSDIFFEKMHKTTWFVPKDRNLLGDKAIDVRDILLDNDLDEADREVTYELEPTGVLCVIL